MLSKKQESGHLRKIIDNFQNFLNKISKEINQFQ